MCKNWYQGMWTGWHWPAWQRHREPVFDIAWCCQPHWMGHGQHRSLKMPSPCWELLENVNTCIFLWTSCNKFKGEYSHGILFPDLSWMSSYPGNWSITIIFLSQQVGGAHITGLSWLILCLQCHFHIYTEHSRYLVESLSEELRNDTP